MAKHVTIRDISSALLRLGFKGPEARNGHIVFQHPATGTLVVLPKRGGNILAQARLAAVRLSIIGRNVATASEFDAALGASHARVA